MGLKKDIELDSVGAIRAYCNIGPYFGNGNDVKIMVRFYLNKGIKDENPMAFIEEREIAITAVHPAENTKNSHYLGLKNVAGWENTEDVLEEA